MWKPVPICCFLRYVALLCSSHQNALGLVSHEGDGVGLGQEEQTGYFKSGQTEKENMAKGNQITQTLSCSLLSEKRCVLYACVYEKR